MIAWCPDCEVGRAARAAVLSGDALMNLWLTVLPFIVAAFVIRFLVRRLDRSAS